MKERADAPPRRFVHPLRAYSDAARPRVEIWRTLLGVAMAGALILALGILARIGAFVALGGSAEGLDFPELLSAAQREASRPSSPASMLLVLATFAAVWPALWLTLRVVHKRNGRTLFGPQGTLNWRHFRIGLGVSLGVGALAWVPVLRAYGTEVFDVSALTPWLMLAVVAAPLIFVQCAAEELFFRGYLLQQIAARSWSILGWSVLPSLLFAFAHPAENGPLGMSWYHFVFGLVMAAVTSRTANLGGAIGIHYGTNLVNLLMVSQAGKLSGLALFAYPEGVDVRAAVYTYIAVMFVGATVFMARMDLKFLRQWKAQKRAQEAAGGEADPMPVRIYAPASRVEPGAADRPPQSAAS